MFQKEFEQPILEGVKDCTIRAKRKDGRVRAKVGERISLRVWTGLPYRSKQREFAQRVVKFTFPVRVEKSGIRRLYLEHGVMDRRRMSRALGFPNWLTARQWYKRVHGLPFDGVLIHIPESK